MFKKIKGLVKNFEARGVLKQSPIGWCNKTEVRKYFETIENDIQKTNGDSDAGKVNAIKERISLIDELSELHDNEISWYIQEHLFYVRMMAIDVALGEDEDDDIDKKYYQYKEYFEGLIRNGKEVGTFGYDALEYEADIETLWNEANNEKKFILYNSSTNTEEELLTKLYLEINFKKSPIQYKLYLPCPINSEYKECILEIYNNNEKVFEVRGFLKEWFTHLFAFTDFIIVRNLNWIPNLVEVQKARWDELASSEDDGKEKKSYEEYLAKKNRSE